MLDKETHLFGHSGDLCEFGTRNRKAYLMYGDKSIAELIEHKCPDESNIQWSLKPYYDNIEYYNKLYCVQLDIPGVCLDLHRPEYNLGKNPVLIQRRLKKFNGFEMVSVLRKLRMERLDVFEFLCRSYGTCDYDLFYITRTPDEVIDVFTESWKSNIPINRRYEWIII